MKGLKKLIVIWIFSFLYANGIEIDLSNEIQDSYFCAICMPRKIDQNKLKNFGIDNVDDGITYYSLVPIETFWGSFKEAQGSLAIHPLLNGFEVTEILVVLRKEDKANPGDWLKQYIPIRSEKVEPDRYLLMGNKPIDKDELMKALKKQAQEMRKKYPLDKQENN